MSRITNGYGPPDAPGGASGVVGTGRNYYSSTPPTSSSPSGTSTKQDGSKPLLDKAALLAILKVLRASNLKGSEEALMQEQSRITGLTPDEIRRELEEHEQRSDLDECISAVVSLSSFSADGDVSAYEENYVSLRKFIDQSLDLYRHELQPLLYPIFVQMYLELVCLGRDEEARNFLTKFAREQDEFYQDDIRKLSTITKKEHLRGSSAITDTFHSKPGMYTVRMSKDTRSYLNRYLHEGAGRISKIVQNIIQEQKINIEEYEGLTRSKNQVEGTIGSMMGEALKSMNKGKVYYGLPREADLPNPMSICDDDDDDRQGGGDDEAGGGDGLSGKMRKKKWKKDLFSKKGRSDPNAPPPGRIPLPDLRDAERLDRLQALKEISKRVRLGPESLPSICIYNLLNAHETSSAAALCCQISEDSSILAAGFSDSTIRVWPLKQEKLKALKPAGDLEGIDKEMDDVLSKMIDEKNTHDCKILYGHSGPVYAVSFSPDRTLLLSCSEDASIRLWSLLTWTNICCYKGHCFPVWDIKFSPHGYYFASCSHDRTARLWATDSHSPLRIFTGHLSDVDHLVWHPNSNYVATGSTDRSIRLWDNLTGNCVRFMTGHKGRIHAMCFSNCGRFLVSGGADCKVLVWDIANGHLIAHLSGHKDAIYAMTFSRCGNILATGGADDSICLWDYKKLIEELDLEELNITQHPPIKTNTDALLLNTFRTKLTSIQHLHFTRRNLLIAMGVYH